HGNRLTAEVLSQLHKNSLAFIEQELTHVSPELKTIVVTHHVPTFIRYPEIYFGDVLNEAFAVELKHFIRKLKPDYWIYGHHHCNTVDFFIDNTLLLTNQMGYVRNHENERFDRSKIITI
ncbi:MAG: metallophosphoesterase, partial [Bacteroidetes bacterium]|nr:metallophosphoesterase [Bacteroidota bacterium]